MIVFVGAHGPRAMRKPGVALWSAFVLAACEPPIEPEQPITGPFTVSIVAGDSQQVVRGIPASQDLVILLRDSLGRPAPGVAVSWAGPALSTFVTQDAHTGTDGRARARWKPSCYTPSGVITVGAAQQPANQAAFTATVVPGVPISLFSADSTVLLEGDVVSLLAVARDACDWMPTGTVTWSVADEAVASLSGSEATQRQLSARAAGRTRVIAVASVGITDTFTVTTLAPVTGIRTIAMVSSGLGCGLDAAGDVHCWGWSGWTKDEPTGTVQPVGARRALTGYGFVALTGGGSGHMCALDAAGAAYCWGANPVGTVGDGTSTPRLTPTAVGGPLRFSSIAASDSHTCAVTAGGEAYCWGLNDKGELGDGTTTNRLVPVPVATSLRFRQVAPSLDFTCGIATDGVTYCWGRGPALWGGVSVDISTVPVALVGAPAFAQIDGGPETACGLTTAGAAYCWGKMYDTPFDEYLLPDDAPSPVPIENGRSYTSIAVGAYHACATTASGAVDCWGGNRRAQLGFFDGGVGTRSSAAAVAVPSLERVFAAPTGSATCGTTAEGKVYCWGEAVGGLARPGSIRCHWGTRISYSEYQCSPPRLLPRAHGETG